MDKVTWELLTQIDGLIQAEVLQSFLEAHDVPVELLRETGMPSTYPFTADEFGPVDVYVQKVNIAQARELLTLFNTPPEEEEKK